MKHLFISVYGGAHGKSRAKSIYSKIIAIGEKSAGNDSVGDMWLETKSFPIDTPVADIMRWAWEKGITGKLVLTVDEGSRIEEVEK